MIVNNNKPGRNLLWHVISTSYFVDENAHVKKLIDYLNLNETDQIFIQKTATELVANSREQYPLKPFDSFLKEYDLSTEEGTTIMCIAESILRIPDTKTGDALIEDKISGANWKKHIGESESLFVNAATWAFLLTGKILKTSKNNDQKLEIDLNHFLYNSSKPIIRQAVQQAIKIISNHFIISNNIENALDKLLKQNKSTSSYSFDMLGEAAITEPDAVKYFDKYMHAIKYIQSSVHNRSLYDAGVSIKLSALHPRYEYTHYESVIQRLYLRLKKLALAAKKADMNFVIDAEEVNRLELQLDLFERLCAEPELKNWQGLGIAVQAYQKRAYAVVNWLVSLAQQSKRRIMLRLVKGAYWDTEIKRAQVLGLKNYPVFTRKESTDVSFLACAKKILNHNDVIYPMFATHNAHSIAAIQSFVGEYYDFEFQRLYGMGEQIYALVNSTATNLKCRVYAPCGEYQELLPYLVRRLLENGANTSFVNQVLDHSIPAEDVATNPIQKLISYSSYHNSKIPLPDKIYQPFWQNSCGLEVAQEEVFKHLQKVINKKNREILYATSIVNGQFLNGRQQKVFNSASPKHQIATITTATNENIAQAIENAQKAFPEWMTTSVEKRAEYLLTIADLLEAHRDEFIQLCIQEAGKTVTNAIAEIREAVDFCRYYSYQARALFTSPYKILDSNVQVEHLGNGVIACISPWNFPLAIFVSQVVAALVAGNTVIAKPAEQTPVIAFKAVQLMHTAGIPVNVLQLIIGGGKIGEQIIEDNRIAGVVFTGSTAVARKIRKVLSNPHRTHATLIAETGGINAMVVDSSALLEQTVKNVIESSFDSAGQRCSALRVVYVQQDIFDEFIRLLTGAMAELIIGDPANIQTDIGPIINQTAKQDLQEYDDVISEVGTLIYKCNSTAIDQSNNYFNPCAYQIDSIDQIYKEAFGPILHVISYSAEKIQTIVNNINKQGYGLTFGIQSRIQTFIEKVSKDIRAGNIYINQNIIGATVGIQPFGGENLSGTGPKAGGPHYLLALTKEKRSKKNNSVKNNVAVIKTDVKEHEYSNQAQIESAINCAEKFSYEFNFMKNETRIEYLNYIKDQLDRNREKYFRNVEVEYSISIINEYKKILINNSKKIVFKIGPTGQRNELHLYNRGPILYANNSQSSLSSFVGTIAANIVIGNPLLIVSNNGSTQVNKYLYKKYIHIDLQEKYIFYLVIKNQAMFKDMLTNPIFTGFIFSERYEKLSEIEKIIANRNGPIVPFIDLQENQLTGGLLANPKNLYLICTERTISTNTTAMGGNTALYSLIE